MQLARFFLFLTLAFLVLGGASCGGGDPSSSDDGDAAVGADAGVVGDVTTDALLTFSVGGSVHGLAGTGLVLDNLGETLSVDVDGPFVFGRRLAKNGAYNVTIRSQPTNPSQTCTVGAGQGTLGNTDVTTVVVTCARTTYTVGGSAHGLVGTGLVLQNNAGDDLAVSASGAFTFATPIASGSAYAVTIASQPLNQTCSVSGATGTVGAGNVSSVVVNCAGGVYTVGGVISGLAGTLVLENNGGDDLMVTANGTFAFATPLAPGAMYAVTIKAQPPSPAQVCVVTAASGTLGMANVTSVSITCTTSTFTIGGNVANLVGTVVLQNNGADDLTLSASGGFTFAMKIASGALYAVTVKTQPSGHTCSVAMGSGTVGTANVTNVAITCATNTYTIGGSISGLVGTVVLRDNGMDDLPISANGPFTFATALASGTTYTVTAFTQPSTQTCTVTAGTDTGTVGVANVASVLVTCVTNTYTVGGTLSGLSGTVVLRNNGGDDLSLSTNGAFTFTTRVASAQPYAVSVFTQPATQTCSVIGGSGNVTNANITSPLVICKVPGGTVMVLRAGDGVTALSSVAAPLFLDERSIADGSVLRTIALPTAVAGSNAPLTIAGSSTSEGGLSLSSDGRFVTLAGYAAPPGTANVASSSAATINRVVGRVDAAGNIDTTTRLNNAFSGANVRAATTTNGSAFWITGAAASTSGVQYALLGSAGASTQIAAVPSNTRHAHVFGGQLYVSAATGTTYGVLTVGSGTPTTAGQTATLLPGFPTATGAPYSFVALDRNVGVAGIDTIYLAQDLSPGANTINVQKWTFDGVTWTQQLAFLPTLTGSSAGTRGLAAFIVPTGVRVVATTNDGASRLVTFIDDGTNTPPVTVLATAALNTAFRGVAFAP